MTYYKGDKKNNKPWSGNNWPSDGEKWSQPSGDLLKKITEIIKEE